MAGLELTVKTKARPWLLELANLPLSSAHLPWLLIHVLSWLASLSVQQSHCLQPCLANLTLHHTQDLPQTAWRYRKQALEITGRCEQVIWRNWFLSLYSHWARWTLLSPRHSTKNFKMYKITQGHLVIPRSKTAIRTVKVTPRSPHWPKMKESALHKDWSWPWIERLSFLVLPWWSSG